MNRIVEEWNALIHEWMIAKGRVYICGLATTKDGAVFAAACAEGDDPVSPVYKSNYEMPLPQEDGSEKMTPIDEPQTIVTAAKTLRAPIGLWVGGQKFKVVRSEEALDHGEHTFRCVFCAKPKGGLHMVVTPKGTIILAIYNEDKGQQGADAKGAALDFAEYLANNGY